jgi:hypothetical protein
LTVVQRVSPKGYRAELKASEVRQLQNSVLLSDTSIEQPGLVVTVYADSASERDRFIATFGGVAATATYGIYPLGFGDSGPPPSCTTSDTTVTAAQAPLPAAPVQLAATGIGAADIPTTQATSDCGSSSTTSGSGANGGGGQGGGTPQPEAIPVFPPGFPPGGAVVAQVMTGIEFLWEHPGLIPPLLAIWALLMWPWYVMARRRALVSSTEEHG